jgi:hypothetical protein
MNPDRVEEVIMGVIAVLMLSYLLPFSLVRNVFATLFIAIGLIVLLIFRSISWHRDAITPFDGILIVGICISALYLFSFYAFQRSALTAIVLVLFAIFYAMMAFFLYQHRWLFLQPRLTHHHASVAHYDTDKHVDHVHDPAFRKGIEPIPEHAPPHHHRRTIRSFFARKAQPHNTAQPRHAHIEPIVQMEAPRPGKMHDSSFKRGMEPIHEITPAHLHRLGVYDLEKKVQPVRKRK